MEEAAGSNTHTLTNVYQNSTSLALSRRLVWPTPIPSGLVFLDPDSSAVWCYSHYRPIHTQQLSRKRFVWSILFRDTLTHTHTPGKVWNILMPCPRSVRGITSVLTHAIQTRQPRDVGGTPKWMESIIWIRTQISGPPTRTSRLARGLPEWPPAAPLARDISIRCKIDFVLMQ